MEELQSELAGLRRTVENDHDHRLQRIESDLRWVIALVSAELAAIVGGAIAIATAG